MEKGTPMNSILSKLTFTSIKGVPEFLLSEEICIQILSTPHCDEFGYLPEKYKNEKIYKEIIRSNVHILKHLKETSEELLNLAVETDGEALKYIPMYLRTEKLCKKAIENNVNAIRYFPSSLLDQATIEKSIRQNPHLISLIPKEKRNRKICRLAVLMDGNTIQYAPSPSFGLSKVAIQSNPKSIEHIPINFLNEETCIEVLVKDGMLLEFIPDFLMTKKIIEIALSNTCDAFQFVPRHFVNERMCKDVLKRNGNMLRWIKNPSENMCNLALESSPSSLAFVPSSYQYYDICFDCVKKDGNCLEFVPPFHRDLPLCIEAVKQNTKSMLYVPDALIQEILQQIEIEPLIRIKMDKKYMTCEIAGKLVMEDGMNLLKIPKSLRTKSLCKLALIKNASSSIKIKPDLLLEIIDDLVQDENHPCLDHLNLIRTLKVGETISSTFSTKMLHHCLSSSIWRTYYSETRHTTLQWIEDVYKMSKTLLICKDLIRDSLENLNVLKITYQEDVSVIEKIEQIQMTYRV